MFSSISAAVFAVALFAGAADAALLPVADDSPVQSTANCGDLVQKASDLPRLCPRPLTTTIIRPAKHVQHA